MTVSHQVASEIEMVVELAVLNRLNRPVFVPERLVPTLYVDNAQPSDTESNARREVGAAVVGTTMGHRVRHPVERPRFHGDVCVALDLNDSADPTHPMSRYAASGRGSTRRSARVNLGT